MSGGLLGPLPPFGGSPPPLLGGSPPGVLASLPESPSDFCGGFPPPPPPDGLEVAPPAEDLGGAGAGFGAGLLVGLFSLGALVCFWSLVGLEPEVLGCACESLAL